MTITVENINTAITAQEFSALVQSANISGQFASEISTAQSNLRTLINEIIANISIIATINGISNNAPEEVKTKFTSLTSEIEALSSKILIAIGSTIKTMSSYTDKVSTAISQFISNLSYAVSFENKKSDLLALLQLLNSVFSSISAVSNSLISSIDSISTQTLNSIRNSMIIESKILTSSLEEIGFGAGIDSIVSIVKSYNSSIEEFTENNMNPVKTTLESVSSTLLTSKTQITNAVSKTQLDKAISVVSGVA